MVDRLATLVASVVVAICLSGCSFRDNPEFCDSADPCGAGFTCNANNRCVAADGGSDGSHDGPTDGVADSAPDGDTRPGCGDDDECPAERPICTLGGCVACDLAPVDGCMKKNPLLATCDNTSGRCVECTARAQCTDSAKPFCVSNACTSCAVAASDACATATPATPVCETTSGTCVECTQNSHCTTATRPICENKQCVACKRDTECAAKLGPDPGICMAHQDGRCATVEETIFVQNNTACSMSAGTGGTVATPYCHPQLAINAVTATKRVVLVRGPNAMDRFSVSQADPQISVIGQGGATLLPGAGVGIQVSAGDLYLRTLTIRGGGGIGVIVQSGATLRMSRCLVENNTGGGIFISGGGFDISNTIVAGNGPGDISGIGFWGGIAVDPPLGGKPARLAHNTISGNNAPGIACLGAVASAAGLIVFGNSTGQTAASCMIAPCCTGDPMLTPTHRLTAGSPCIDKQDPLMSVPDDIDGESRPKGPKSDCGADEF